MKSAKLLLCVGLLVFATACGKQEKLVLDASLRTLTEGTRNYLQLQALVDTGNMTVPGGEIPIQHPHVPGVVLGTVSLYPATKAQTSQITLKLDLDETFYEMGADGRTLPNGALIPVDRLGNATPIGFKAGKYSRAYVALGDNVAMVGAALVIKEFDNFSDDLPYINVFPEFKFGRVRGTAGIFTGAQTLQSGVAIFVDAGQIFNRQSPSPLSGRVMTFGTKSSSQELNAAGYGLYKLNRKASRMTLK
jgi:hypothetical protein